MLRRFSLNFALLSMLLDGIIVAICLKISAIIRVWLNQFSYFDPVESSIATPAPLYIIFPILWVLIFISFSIYDGKRFLRVVDEMAGISIATIIASISSAGILYFSFRDVSRALFLIFVVLTYFLIILWRLIARIYFRTQKVPMTQQRRVLIVGAGTLGQRVQNQLSAANSPNLAFVGFVDDGLDVQGKMLGGKKDIFDIVRQFQISDVIIALPYSAYTDMGPIVQSLDEAPVQIWVALGFFDLALYKTTIESFADIPMIDLRASAIDDYQRLVKRIFDFIICCVGMVLALPVMVLISVAILLDDGFPVLFKQKRLGENARPFDMLKFRTMVKNAEELRDTVEHTDNDGNLVHKTRNDPRVTRVGRFLRRFSLDELPQIFNILAGSMSLVGPRPEMPWLVEKYQPWQRKRFAVPPGLTGWWQITGRSDKPMHLHTEDDLYYIQNYSIWLDIQILVRTVWVVLVGKGSY